MRVTPARSWTEASSKVTRTGCWRAWRSRRMRSVRRGIRLLPRRVPARSQPPAEGHPATPNRGASLGTTILETDFGFDVDVRLGAGAFVCGEETALIASIEGGRGTPVPRPPYPGGSRACGRQPTLINNVETFANIAPIIRNGGDWFAAHRARRQARAPRSSHWLAGSSTPGSSKCRWARPCARSSSTSAAGSSRSCLQGRPDRRAGRWLYPARVPGHARGLRVAHAGRLVHGLGRHDRDGRDIVHGQRGRVLHGLLREESCGKCVPVPGRAPPNCG